MKEKECVKLVGHAIKQKVCLIIPAFCPSYWWGIDKIAWRARAAILDHVIWVA
jgi:hypothetical protein